jgi:PAS domain S-box-containing protein
MKLEDPFIRAAEAPVWRDLYRVLFDRNVAGVILTNAEGRIIDCNEPSAGILGFESKKEMLTHSAWELYFHRNERELVLEKLRSQRNCSAEEVCLRGKGGVPIWVLATRTVVSFVNALPKLIQATIIDLAAQKKAQAMLTNDQGASCALLPDGKEVELNVISQKLAPLLRRVNATLQPCDQPRISRAEFRACSIALEQMKMLMAEWEMCSLFRD